MEYNKTVRDLAWIISSALSVSNEKLSLLARFCLGLAYKGCRPELPDKWNSEKLLVLMRAIDKAYDINSYDAAQAADPERAPDDVPPSSDEVDRRFIRNSIITATPEQIRSIAKYTAEVTGNIILDDGTPIS